jgi:hypothetical protein
MQLLGSIHTFLITENCFVFILALLSQPPPGRERCKMEIKHLTGCLEKAFKIGCFKFHNLAPFEDRDTDLYPSTLGGRKIMEYKAPH